MKKLGLIFGRLLINVSVLIYSHNYTEIFGTQNPANKIAVQIGIKEMIRQDEPHY